MYKIHQVSWRTPVLLLLLAFLSPFTSINTQAQNTGVVLSGRIVDDHNRSPLMNVSIEISSLSDTSGRAYSVFTNQDGDFEWKGNIAYPVRILINHQGYRRKELVLDNRSNSSLTIELTELLEDVRINGRVVKSSDRTAIESATVKLLAINDDQLSGRTTVTGADGRFSFSAKVNPNINNEVELSVSHPDYLTFKSKVVYETGKDYVLEVQPQSHYIRLAGKVVDKVEKRPIEFVSIQVLPGDTNATLEKAIGTTTDIEGNFEFTFRFSVPLRLKFSHISYRDEEILINDPTFKRLKVEMLPEAVTGEEVYVISNIVSEDELKSTGTIDKVSNLEIQEIASLSAFDLVSTLREVDVSTQSLNLQSVSTRGFNATANPRFLQLTDGVDNEAPGLGFPLGNLMGPSDLDIASIELLVGPSTTKYGSSALSGVLLTNSKDPFVSKGLDVSTKAGLHNFKFGGADAWAVEGEEIYDISLRYANVLFDKLAFKVSGTLTSGTDWEANNYDNHVINETWLGMDHEDPGYNGVNLYGDENYTFLPVGINRQDNPGDALTPVTRTGYKEADLVDYDISTRKLAGSLHYKFQEQTRLTVEGRYGYTNTLYTSDSRIRLEDFEMFQIKSEFSTHNFSIRGYTTQQNSGDSYNINTLSNQLITNAKSNANWYRDFRIAYENGLTIYGVPPKNLPAARRFADGGATLLFDQEANPRYLPGTSEFEAELERLKEVTGFGEGAGIRDNTQLYHMEGNNTFEDLLGSNITVGGSYRFYDVDSRGTIFPDTVGNDITNYEYGAYVQADKNFLDEDLISTASLRLAKSENFGFQLSQQVGFNYNLNEKHYLRFSYQNGFRYPTLREQLLNTNISKGRLLGGLGSISDPYDLQLNAFIEQSVFDYNDAVVESLGLGFSRPQAELQNLPVLQRGILDENGLKSIKPEKTHSFEVGYRQLINARLYFDVNYFVSLYDDFIGIKRFVKPRTSPSTDLNTAAGQINNASENDSYYVYSNAGSSVTAQGVSFDVTYTSGNFISSLNGTWSRLFKSPNDPIIPGYNTPPFKLNFEWGNREIITNLGFKMTFRLRSPYNWQSSFLDGKIPGYGHFDFQFNVRLPSLRSKIKTGVTNMGVLPYYDTFGGPAVGSILFTTFTFSPGSF